MYGIFRNMKNRRIAEIKDSQPDQRLIKLQGANNFRDMGGYTTRDGRSMKRGLFYRSDDLSHLSDDDLEKLRQLNIKTICDLRAPNERKSKPDRIPQNAGIRVVHAPICPHQKDPNGFQRWFLLVTSRFRNFDPEDFMREYYHRTAFDNAAQIGEIIAIFSNKNNLPALVHCAGGKDRTGYIAALLQLFVGVPWKTVLEDFLLSNRLMKSRSEKIIRQLRWISLFQVRAELLRPIMVAYPHYLERIMDDVLKAYGTIEEYLNRACGVSHDTIRNLRQQLLD
jgi:protein-tyrosine phosphatase